MTIRQVEKQAPALRTADMLGNRYKTVLCEREPGRFDVPVSNVVLPQRLLGEHVTASKQLDLAFARRNITAFQLLREDCDCLVGVTTIERYARTASSTREDDVAQTTEVGLRMPYGDCHAGSQQRANPPRRVSEMEFARMEEGFWKEYPVGHAGQWRR